MMRARAILVAWVLAMQAIGPSLALAATARPACCCAAQDKKCHCPSCTRDRAIEQGHGVVVSCGFGTEQALSPSPQIAVPPALDPAPALGHAAPSPLLAAAPPSVALEVPTPPPLQ